MLRQLNHLPHQKEVLPVAKKAKLVVKLKADRPISSSYYALSNFKILRKDVLS